MSAMEQLEEVAVETEAEAPEQQPAEAPEQQPAEAPEQQPAEAPEQAPEQPPGVALAVPEVIEAAPLAIVPPGDEMRALVQLAVTFSAAELVPRALRDKPNDVLLILLTARDLGIKLTTALRLCYPIDGSVTIAPKLKLAIIRERGLGKVRPDPGNDEHAATWYGVRADDPDYTFAATFTWEDAQRPVGRNVLVDPRCASASSHHDGCNCKDNWRNFPARMLSWRALGFLMDDAFGEVGSGLYSPDELGAVTDDEGAVVIDVKEVGPLEGTAEPPSMKRARRQAAAAAKPPDAPAPEEERSAIADAYRALPEPCAEERLRFWHTADLPKIADLTPKQAKKAWAVIDSLIKRAEAGEWGEWQRPAEHPTAESGTEGEPETPEALTEPSDGQSEQSGGISEGLPALGDIEQVIDWTKALPSDELDRWVEQTGAAPANNREAEKRRALAQAAAGALGLL